MIIESDSIKFGDDFICLRRYSYVPNVAYISVNDILFGICNDGVYRAQHGNIYVEGVDSV